MPYGTAPPISSTMFEYQYPEIFDRVCQVQWNDLQGLDEPNCFSSAGRYDFQAHEWHPHVIEQQQLLETLKPWRVATASWYHKQGGYNKVWGSSPGKWPLAQHHPLFLNDLDTVVPAVPPFRGQKLPFVRTPQEFVAAFPEFDTKAPRIASKGSDEDYAGVFASVPTRKFTTQEEFNRFFDVAQRTDDECGEAKDADVRSPSELPEYADGQTGVGESVATPEPVWGPYEREHRCADDKIAYTKEQFHMWFGNKAQAQWDKAEVAPFNVFRKGDKPDRK